MLEEQGRPREHRKCVFLVTKVEGALRDTLLRETKRPGVEKPGTAHHASVVVCFRRVAGKPDLEFLAFQYTKKKNGLDWTTFKFPTETGMAGEDPLKTAVSCLCQELAKNPSDFKFKFVNEQKPIYEKSFESDARRGEVGKHDEEEVLGIPEWFEAERLFGLMEQRGVRFHRVALLRALQFFGDTAIRSRYFQLLSDSEYANDLTDRPGR